MTFGEEEVAELLDVFSGELSCCRHGHPDAQTCDCPCGNHFSAMTLPCWLRRAVMNRHRHAIEQASHRWRGGRRED
jgi:hypothetical protein